jgi:hypothetical protein
VRNLLPDIVFPPIDKKSHEENTRWGVSPMRVVKAT